MKTITITNYNKFRCTEIPESMRKFINSPYKGGMWNVFFYTPQLEKFLREKEIAFIINED